MKALVKVLLILIVFASPLYCQLSASNIFDNNWKTKADDFKKKYKNQGLVEQDLSAMAGKGTKMMMVDDKLDGLPVKLTYTFTELGLAVKGIMGAGTDQKSSEKMLKAIKDLATKKLGKKPKESDVKGMKVQSWEISKTMSATMMQMGNNVVLQVMNMDNLPKGK